MNINTADEKRSLKIDGGGTVNLIMLTKEGQETEFDLSEVAYAPRLGATSCPSVPSAKSRDLARDDGTSAATPATPQKRKVVLPREKSAKRQKRVTFEDDSSSASFSSQLISLTRCLLAPVSTSHACLGNATDDATKSPVLWVDPSVRWIINSTCSWK